MQNGKFAGSGSASSTTIRVPQRRHATARRANASAPASARRAGRPAHRQSSELVHGPAHDAGCAVQAPGSDFEAAVSFDAGASSLEAAAPPPPLRL